MNVIEIIEALGNAPPHPQDNRPLTDEEQSLLDDLTAGLVRQTERQGFVDHGT